MSQHRVERVNLWSSILQMKYGSISRIYGNDVVGVLDKIAVWYQNTVNIRGFAVAYHAPITGLGPRFHHPV